MKVKNFLSELHDYEIFLIFVVACLFFYSPLNIGWNIKWDQIYGFLNGDAFLTGLSTFVAAFSAYLIVMVVEWYKEQKKLLSEINYTKTLLNEYFECLSAFYVDQVREQNKNFNNMSTGIKNAYTRDIAVLNNFGSAIDSLGGFSAFEFDVRKMHALPEVPIKEVSKYAVNNTDLVRGLLRTRQAIQKINYAVERFNKEYNEIIEFDDCLKYPLLFGLPYQIGTAKTVTAQNYKEVVFTKNMKVMDLLDHIYVDVEYALYFIFYVQVEITRFSDRQLIGGLRRCVIRLYPIKKDHPHYVLVKDVIKRISTEKGSGL